jgi:hypothetical protein
MHDAAIMRTDILLQSATPVFVSAPALHRDGPLETGASLRPDWLWLCIARQHSHQNSLPGGQSMD